MTEEEYFRKYYPDFCYGDRPLSPHWDFFQEGVEFGERQSEKKIEELEKELKNWKDEWQEQVQKAIDEGYARTLQTMQLTKAKDLLLRFIELKNKPCAVGHSVNMLLYENICADVQKFLKEIEK